MGDDTLTSLSTFSEQFPGIQALILNVGYLIGLGMVIAGLHMWAMNNQRGHHAHGQGLIFGLLICGALLMSIVATMTLTATSLFGQSADPRIVLAAVPVDRENPLRMSMKVAFNFAALLGWVAVIRGVYNIAMAGSKRQTSFWVGFWFLVGGAACANMELFMTLTARSFGADALIPFFRGV